MRFNRLDLNLLVALDALLEEKKITRAATRLNVSQSAISGMLARLRVYFDDQLLVQVGRSMQLTPLGSALADPVRQLLLQVESTIALRHEFVPETVDRHFRIAASDYTASIMVAPLIRRLRQLAPGITIELVALHEHPADIIRSGSADLLLIPRELASDEQPYESLPADSYTCLAWNQNSIVGKALDMATFLACGHVTTSFGVARQPSMDERFFRQHGIERKLRVIAHDFNSVPQIVAGTDLLATMPTRLATLAAERYPIRLFAPPMKLPPLQHCMQWHRHHTDEPCHRWIRKVMLDVAGAKTLTPAPAI